MLAFSNIYYELDFGATTVELFALTVKSLLKFLDGLID